jgi:hypothetical protein
MIPARVRAGSMVEPLGTGMTPMVPVGSNNC